MEMREYFRSLSSECTALKNRVRMMIAEGHWPTDGEWKESVLRNMIRRNSPSNVTVGRGFVLSRPDCSTQIDVLVYDNNSPIFYRDGDLVFVPPDACRAIIEVKSRTGLTLFREAAERIATNAKLIRNGSGGRELFVGIFAYELNSSPRSGNALCSILNEVAAGDRERIIDHVALGPDRFAKYWRRDPELRRNGPYNTWHSYNLPEMAQGYFIHNLVTSLGPDLVDANMWFPEEGKETQLDSRVAFSPREGSPDSA